MTVKHAELEPGWLKKQMDDVEALFSGYQKIVDGATTARKHGFTSTFGLELSIAELNALAYMARVHLQR
jgi:hypothetical protein